MAAPMAGTGRLAARRKARLLPTGRVAHGLAQRSRAVHPLPPPRLETEQRSSPPPLPPPCAVRPTRRHSAPRHCSTWGPTAASAAAAAAGPTAAAPFQIRLGRAGPKTARRRPASNYDPRRPGPTLTAPTGGDPHLRCGDPQLPFHPACPPLFAANAARKPLSGTRSPPRTHGYYTGIKNMVCLELCMVHRSPD